MSNLEAARQQVPLARPTQEARSAQVVENTLLRGRYVVSTFFFFFYGGRKNERACLICDIW